MSLYGEIHTAIYDATTKTVNSAYPSLPPIAWTLRGIELLGQVDDYEYRAGSGPEGVARAWAERLGCAGRVCDTDGTVAFSGGYIEAMPVEIWYVADRDAFEARARRLKEAHA
jgi:hypothetical protein